MSRSDVSPEEAAKRGKRLLLYGMFVVAVVTFVGVFLWLFLVTGAFTGGAGLALQTALVVAVITLVACIILWFVYTKLILKE